MAKVGFWLRGARGKMGGAVLSKSENGTIARENVTPKNPRTNKQMYQRAIFATIASAAKAMKQLINHSFYGFAEGNKCIQEFRRINLNKLRNKVAADIAAEYVVTDGIAMLAPKGYKFIVPNEYQISSGTLPSPSVNIQKNSANTALLLGGVGYDIEDDITVKEFITNFLGINPGEQLTLAYVSVNSDIEVANYSEGHDDATGYVCKENIFGALRMVLNPESAANYTTDITYSDLSAAKIVTALKSVCDMSKSDEKLFELLENTILVTSGEGSKSIAWNSNTSLVIDSKTVKAAAVIRSKFENGQWNYNTAMMTIAIPDEDYNYGVVPATAVASYTDGVSVGTSNDPFLDEGGEGGSL